MNLKIHWFAVTIKSRKMEYGLALWDVWFSPYLGEMQSSGHGGQGFQNIFKSLAGARLYGNPSGMDRKDMDTHYFNIELPGQACDAIPDFVFREFMMELQLHEKFHLTRLDLAWDGVPFTPEQVKNAIANEHIRTHAMRSKVVCAESPWEQKENGEMGTSSLSIGSRSSERMLRTYDRRGPVRLEFQTRHKRATMIANDVLIHPVDQWADLAISHLRDYIDFLEKENEELLPWWEKFVRENVRANKTVKDARERELDRMILWIYHQVSPTLSVLVDVIGEKAVLDLVDEGREKRGKRYDEVLKLAGKLEKHTCEHHPSGDSERKE